MRITNTIRESVEKRILNERYKDRENDILRALQKHATKLQEATYPKGIETCGEWVPMTGYIYVNTPKRTKRQRNISLDHSVYYKRGNSVYFDEDEVFCALFDQEEKLADAKIEDGRVIRAVLWSCSTSKQLLETAPELAKYLPDDNAPVGNALVDMATINQFRAMLG